MSNLHQVLSEYSVPLQIWLAPEARNKVADVLISEMGDKAHIHPHPLPQIDGLRGPAVLVITANEINGSGQDALRVLAQKAHPGRAVLIGGTSDRDTLMNAINNWGVVRVVPSNAEDDAIIEAVRAAGAYLNREVAMETAIDDLDIETTMLDSAIDQLEGSRERTREIDKTNITTTFTTGMLQILEREKVQLNSIVPNLEADQTGAIRRAIAGMDVLSEIIEKSHDHAIEKSAGIPPSPEALDPLVQHIRTLLGVPLGGHIGSGTSVCVDPFALFHTLISICRNPSLGGVTSIDTHRTGNHAVITLLCTAPLPDGFVRDLKRNTDASWKTFHEAGGEIRANPNPNEYASIELVLPAQDEPHA